MHPRRTCSAAGQRRAHDRQDGDLDEALPEVRRVVLEDLDRDLLLRLEVDAAHDLPERPLAQQLEDPVARQRVRRHRAPRPLKRRPVPDDVAPVHDKVVLLVVKADDPARPERRQDVRSVVPAARVRQRKADRQPLDDRPPPRLPSLRKGTRMNFH